MYKRLLRAERDGVPLARISACFPFPANLGSLFYAEDDTPISLISIKMHFWSRRLRTGKHPLLPTEIVIDLLCCSKLL